jgi:hypothetical protein
LFFTVTGIGGIFIEVLLAELVTVGIREGLVMPGALFGRRSALVVGERGGCDIVWVGYVDV